MSEGSHDTPSLGTAGYAVLAARRLQWDTLLWQVPVLGLTAQAFLFTISLDPTTSRVGRALASTLSLVASVMAMQLMASHRQAEIADAHILGEFEVSSGGTVLHGPGFRARRDSTNLHAWFPAGGLVKLRSFDVWMFGLSLFGLASLGILLSTFVAPALLER